MQQRRLVVLAVQLVGRDDDGGGYLVVGFEVEQADALGGAAGGADGLGVDADDLAELADDHQLAGVVDQLNAADAADARGDGHVLDALAAAGLQAVVLDIGALAKAVFGDGQDAVRARLVLLGSDGDADDVIVFGEVDAAHAVGRAAHGADVVFVEADGHAEMRGEEDDLRAVGDAGGDQFVVLVDADGDNAAGHDVARSP